MRAPAQSLLQDPAVRLAFELEGLLQAFLSQLEQHMAAHGLTREDLEQRMGAPSAVTQLFQEENPTLETMVRVALAAGLRVGLSLGAVAS